MDTQQPQTNLIEVKLFGTPACRRYQKMKELVIKEAMRLDISINLHEIGDTEHLSQINPLSLPRLYITDELIASQNPPKPQEIAQALVKRDCG